MDVSIIIVNYNTKDLILQCLKSIFELTKNVDFEVIVVDNASSDSSCNEITKNFPQVKVIESFVNSGFGRANNFGAKRAKGKYLFFLNPDCLLIENTIKVFYEFMEINNVDDSIGAVGAMLYDKTMKLNTSYHRFPAIVSELKYTISLIFNKLFLPSSDPPKTYNYSQSYISNEVDFISGADLFILKKRFDELNGFDEQFFLFYEEADLQKRMSAKGLKRIILENQKIIHLEGYSYITSSPSLKSTIIFRDSLYKYFRKHVNFISYIFFYLTITPLLIYPLFSRKYSVKEKKEYCRMLLRRHFNESEVRSTNAKFKKDSSFRLWLHY